MKKKLEKRIEKEFIISILNKILNSPTEKPISFYVRLIGKEVSFTYKVIHLLEEKGYISIYSTKWDKNKHNRFKSTKRSIEITDKGKTYLKRNTPKSKPKEKVFEENLWEE